MMAKTLREHAKLPFYSAETTGLARSTIPESVWQWLSNLSQATAHRITGYQKTVLLLDKPRTEPWVQTVQMPSMYSAAGLGIPILHAASPGEKHSLELLYL